MSTLVNIVADAVADDYPPLSALNDYLFCARRCALHRLEGIWVENLHTQAGTFDHRRAHEPRDADEGPVRVARGLRLVSHRLRLVGVADLVEFHPQANEGSPENSSNSSLSSPSPLTDIGELSRSGNGPAPSASSPSPLTGDGKLSRTGEGLPAVSVSNGNEGAAPPPDEPRDFGLDFWRTPIHGDRHPLFPEGGDELPYPVEYKRGKRRKWDNDDVQLCAQAICLEEMLRVSVPRGAIFHVKSRRRREVVFDARLRRTTSDTAARLHELLASGVTPPPIVHPKCRQCSLYSVCLPELIAAPAAYRRAAAELFAVGNVADDGPHPR